MIASSVSAGDGAERTGLFYCSQPADCTALPCTIFAVLNFIQWGAIRLCPVARFKPNEVRKSTKKSALSKANRALCRPDSKQRNHSSAALSVTLHFHVRCHQRDKNAAGMTGIIRKNALDGEEGTSLHGK